jgi:hypothetical protein
MSGPMSISGTSGTTTTQTNARLATGTRRRLGPTGTPKWGSTNVASRTDGLRPFGSRCAPAADHACAAVSCGCPCGGFSSASPPSRRSVRRCTSTSNRASLRSTTRVVAAAAAQETRPPPSATVTTITAATARRAEPTTRRMATVCDTPEPRRSPGVTAHSLACVAYEASGHRGRASPSGSACQHRYQARPSFVLAGRALRVPAAPATGGLSRSTAVGRETC